MTKTHIPPAVQSARQREQVRQLARPPAGKANVLWWSNAPWAPTGYGMQTAEVVRRIHDDGHKVAISTNYGLAGAMQDWGGVPCFPQGFAQYSQDVMFAHWEVWDSRNPGPTALISLYDVWVMTNQHLPRVPVIAPWVPVDHAPAPPAVSEWLRRPNVMPVAMSKFGQRMLELDGIDADYVPHGVNTSLFRPGVTVGDDRTGRDLLNVGDDRFVVMLTAANKGTYPNRKAFAEQLLAFASFAQRHDDALLYLHTTIRGSGGIDLDHLIQGIPGLDPAKVRFVDQFAYLNGMPAEVLAALYGAADVFMCVSRGEGFGIPVIEAQACGTPVVVNDATAQSELVGDGWAVSGQPDWDGNQRAWYQTPFIGAIDEALEDAYRRGRGVSDKALVFAAGYDHDRVFDEMWRPVLEKIGRRLVAAGSGAGGAGRPAATKGGGQ